MHITAKNYSRGLVSRFVGKTGTDCVKLLLIISRQCPTTGTVVGHCLVQPQNVPICFEHLSSGNITESRHWDREAVTFPKDCIRLITKYIRLWKSRIWAHSLYSLKYIDQMYILKQCYDIWVLVIEWSTFLVTTVWIQQNERSVVFPTTCIYIIFCCKIWNKTR